MSDADTQATLTGQVIYRERMMPRPGSTLTVTLEDVSRADAPSEVLGIFETTLEGGPPYEFRIEYDPASIDERMRYNLRARIERDGRLLWTSTESLDPFGPQAPEQLEILVQQVGDRPR